MAKLAPDLHGIAPVNSASARDALYPVPELNRRVYRTDTRVQERWNGVAWVIDPIDYANIANAPGVDAAFANNPITTLGLSYGYNAGVAAASGGFARIAAGSVGLVDNAVNYIERSYTGVVSRNTSAFTATNIPMAKVTTVGGAITLIEDWRTPPAPVQPFIDNAAFGQDLGGTTGLTYGYAAGTAVVAGVVSKIPLGTVTLLNNTTNYVERTYAGVVSANTTGFTPGSIPMAKVTTVGGAITVVQDWRTPAAPVDPYPLVTNEVGVTDVRYPVGHVHRYGALGNNTADDTAAFAAAVAAASLDNKVIQLMPTKTYKVGNVTVTGKRVTISGYGATINCTSALGAIKKTDHDNLLTVLGVTFTGSGRAINVQCTPDTNTFFDYNIVDCKFTMAAGVYGIYLQGAREGFITRCSFNGPGNGIYYQQSVSPFVKDSIFIGSAATGRGIFYDGIGSGFDAGLIIRDCEIMGWDKGVEVKGTQFVAITGSTIDYNNTSLKLAAQEGADIYGNYLGSVGPNPALTIADDLTVPTGITFCAQIAIYGNQFTGHFTGASTYDCISVSGNIDRIRITNNDIAFYTRYGIAFDANNGALLIEKNDFAARSTFGVAPIHNTSGGSDSAVRILGNFFTNATTITAMNVAFAKVNDNVRCTTENTGTGSCGTGVATFNIAHGCSYTPAATDVTILPTNAEAASKNAFFGGADATNIAVNFSANTAASASVAWRIRRGA